MPGSLTLFRAFLACLPVAALALAAIALAVPVMELDTRFFVLGLGVAAAFMLVYFNLFASYGEKRVTFTSALLATLPLLVSGHSAVVVLGLTALAVALAALRRLQFDRPEGEIDCFGMPSLR